MQAVYSLLNLGTRVGASAAGWAVPMATDIAFAMGVFGFFRSRMPAGAEAFLLTLATVDDLGAIAVIAILCAPARAGAFTTARATLTRHALWRAQLRRLHLPPLPHSCAGHLPRPRAPLPQGD